MMERPVAPVFDVASAREWARLVPWWVPRVVLTVGWVAATTVAIVVSDQPCTPSDPSVCGPALWFGYAGGLLLATPILLWTVPLAGCVTGALFSLLDVVYDTGQGIHIAFALFGSGCALMAWWLVVGRRRQTVLMRRVAGETRVAVSPEPIASFGPRVVLGVVLLMTAGASLLWYRHQVAGIDEHLAAAQRIEVPVTALDPAASQIVVRLDASTTISIEVVSVDTYHVGESVPVFADRRGDQPWVQLVAEPDDETFWLSVAVLAAVLAGIVLGRQWRARMGCRRLGRSAAPAVDLLVEPDSRGRAVLRVPEPGGRGPRLAIVPVVYASPDAAQDEDAEQSERGEWSQLWTPAERAAFARSWRGEDTSGEFDQPPPWQPAPPQPATVVGDLRDGGWVALITDEHMLVPTAPLRMVRPRLIMPWRRDVDVSDEEDRQRPGDLLPGHPVGPAAAAPPLPLVLRARRRDRVLGALLLLAAPTALLAVLVGLPEDWWQALAVLWTGGAVATRGWMRRSARVILQQAFLEVRAGFRRFRVPWARLHGVRQSDDRLYLAGDPDFGVQVGPFDARDVPQPPDDDHPPSCTVTAERAAGLIMSVRERGLAAGDPGTPIRQAPSNAAYLAIAYLITAIATIFIQSQ